MTFIILFSIYCLIYRKNWLILNIIHHLKLLAMKKLTFIFAFTVLLGATSCVKDWQCECTDGTSTNVVETYPNTKLLDAKKVCDGREKDLKTLNSNISCKIK